MVHALVAWKDVFPRIPGQPAVLLAAPLGPVSKLVWHAGIETPEVTEDLDCPVPEPLLGIAMREASIDVFGNNVVNIFRD